MKSFLVLTALLISNFAQANTLSFNCLKGEDNGWSGKYCHYKFPECSSDSCINAATCIVEKVAREREGIEVKAYHADFSVIRHEGEEMMAHRIQSHKENCNGRQCLTPIIVYTRGSKIERGLCEPIAIQIVGDQDFKL